MSFGPKFALAQDRQLFALILKLSAQQIAALLLFVEIRERVDRAEVVAYLKSVINA
jgi:hypothetical protein